MPKSIGWRLLLLLTIPLVLVLIVLGRALTAQDGAKVPNLALALAVAGIFFFDVIFLGVFWVTRTLRRDVNALASVAKRIGDGHTADRAGDMAFVEAQVLADAINGLAEGVERQLRSGAIERDTLITIIDTMPDALLLLGDDGVVRIANPSALRLFGAGDARIVGARMMEVVRDFEIASVMESAVRSGNRQSSQVVYGPERRLLNVTATPIVFQSERGILLMAQDLTELQRLEGVRKDFVANVSHELRTPLASVKAAVETLQGGALQDPVAAQDFLARINVEVDHLTDMVQQLLDLSRIETGRVQFAMKPAELGPLITEAVNRVRTQADRKRISVTVEKGEGIPLVMADAAAIHRVVINLLDNSMKYTPDGGTIVISARRADKFVEVTVRDTGGGIAATDLPHIFERFYKADRSRSSKGVGLGLALCKHIIQAHSGIIWAESELGKGAAFRFTLPVAAQSAS